MYIYIRIYYIYTVSTFKYTDLKYTSRIEQVFLTTSGKVFLGPLGHLNIRNPIHLNIWELHLNIRTGISYYLLGRRGLARPPHI